VAAAAAAQLRTQAKAALDAGKPLDCLRLLDEASRTDPTGDAAPDIQALRARATKAIPPLKPGNH
jgi:hypothetical protein